NDQDYFGNTAAMYALGHVKILETLHRHGADISICNYEEQTPLRKAINDKIDASIEYLLKPVLQSLRLCLDGQIGNLKETLASSNEAFLAKLHLHLDADEKGWLLLL